MRFGNLNVTPVSQKYRRKTRKAQPPGKNRQNIYNSLQSMQPKAQASVAPIKSDFLERHSGSGSLVYASEDNAVGALADL